MRVRLLAALALIAALAAGCGSSKPKPYTAAGTASCLRTQGFKDVTTDSAKVGFVAGFADNGGIRATSADGNTVTIAFTADDSAVPGTESAFRRQATGTYKTHIRDVMESQRNAVLVWATTPAQQTLNLALGCLHS